MRTLSLICLAVKARGHERVAPETGSGDASRPVRIVGARRFAPFAEPLERRAVRAATVGVL